MPVPRITVFRTALCWIVVVSVIGIQTKLQGQETQLKLPASGYGEVHVPGVLIRTIPDRRMEELTQDVSRMLQPIQKVTWQQSGGEETQRIAAQIGSIKTYPMLQPIGSRPRRSTSQSAEVTLPGRSGSAASQAQTESQVEPQAQQPTIEIYAQSFERGFRDNYSFVVANNGSDSVPIVTARLVAPEGCTLHQIVPQPSRISGRLIEVEFRDLGAGDRAKIEIAISYPRDRLAQFQTSIVRVMVDTNTISHGNSAQNQMLRPAVSRQQKTQAILASSTKSMIDQSPADITDDEVSAAAIEKQETQDLDAASTAVKSIRTTLEGPQEVQLDAEVDFAIKLVNISAEAAKQIVVQLKIPSGLQVTVLDREAWFDEANGLLTWELSKLDATTVETIRYRAKGSVTGTVSQTVRVGKKGVFQSAANLESRIVSDGTRTSER